MEPLELKLKKEAILVIKESKPVGEENYSIKKPYVMEEEGIEGFPKPVYTQTTSRSE